MSAVQQTVMKRTTWNIGDSPLIAGIDSIREYGWHSTPQQNARQRGSVMRFRIDANAGAIQRLAETATSRRTQGLAPPLAVTSHLR